MNLVKVHKGRLNFHGALIILAAKELKTAFIISFDEDFDQVEGIKRIKEPSELKEV